MHDYQETPWMDRIMIAGIVSVMLAVCWAGIDALNESLPAMATADTVLAARQTMAVPSETAQPAASDRDVVATDVDTVKMFECQQNGQSVMSDRPCSADAAAPASDSGRPKD